MPTLDDLVRDQIEKIIQAIGPLEALDLLIKEYESRAESTFTHLLSMRGQALQAIKELVDEHPDYGVHFTGLDGEGGVEVTVQIPADDEFDRIPEAESFAQRIQEAIQKFNKLPSEPSILGKSTITKNWDGQGEQPLSPEP